MHVVPSGFAKVGSWSRHDQYPHHINRIKKINC